MITRQKGIYNPGHYFISPETSDQSCCSQEVQSIINHDQEMKDFLEEVNYEILRMLNYRSKSRPYCSFRLKCKLELAELISNEFNLSKSRYTCALRFINENQLSTERWISNRNVIRMIPNSFRMKILARKPIKYNQNCYAYSKQVFICFEFRREKEIITEN